MWKEWRIPGEESGTQVGVALRSLKSAAAYQSALPYFSSLIIVVGIAFDLGKAELF